MLSVVQHEHSAQVPVLQKFMAQHLRSMTPDQKVLLIYYGSIVTESIVAIQ